MMINHVLDVHRCALWADMGMGKGVAVLTALDAADLIEPVWPALALGPLRVARDVWTDEVNKWEHLSHLDAVSLVGDEKYRTAAVTRDVQLHAINYEMVAWLVEYWGSRFPYRTIIADESSKLRGYRGSFQRHPTTGKTFLRHAGGTRARALATVAHTKAKRFVETTGTPSPNGLANLWGQLWYLDGGRRLGRTYSAFIQRWFQTGRDGYSVKPMPFAQEEIQNLIRDVCLSVDPSDWLDLDKPQIVEHWVTLPPTAMRHYREMERSMFTELERDTVEAFGAAARSQKCLQLANGAVYVDPDVQSEKDPRARRWSHIHDAKLEMLDSIIEEASGAPMIVVYQFRSDLARIRARYAHAVDLASTEGLRAFKAGGVAIGVAHPDSVGHGIDGIEKVCNVITFFGHWWDLETYDQIIGRIGPMRQMQSGMNRLVYVNHIFAKGTIDEDIRDRRVTKRTVQDILRAAMKRRTT